MALMLSVVGTATVHSASAEMPVGYLTRQLAWIGAGALLFWLAGMAVPVAAGGGGCLMPLRITLVAKPGEIFGCLPLRIRYGRQSRWWL